MATYATTVALSQLAQRLTRRTCAILVALVLAGTAALVLLMTATGADTPPAPSNVGNIRQYQVPGWVDDCGGPSRIVHPC